MNSNKKSDIEPEDKDAFRAKMLDFIGQADHAIEQASQYLNKNG